MKKKTIVILPLATALAPFIEQGEAQASGQTQMIETSVERADTVRATVEKPNVKFAVGNALLGLKVFRSSEGVLMAAHSSHSSHSSHASHASHASSRY